MYMGLENIIIYIATMQACIYSAPKFVYIMHFPTFQLKVGPIG